MLLYKNRFCYGGTRVFLGTIRQHPVVKGDIVIIFIKLIAIGLNRILSGNWYKRNIMLHSAFATL